MGKNDCKLVNTSIFESQKYTVNEEDVLGPNYATQYKSVVGDLQYLIPTRWDIAFPLNKVWQYLHFPTTVHWQQSSAKLDISSHTSGLVKNYERHHLCW